MGDEFTAENQSGETSEYYVLPKGFSGDYKLYVRKVWGEVAAGKVTVEIYNHFRSDNEKSHQEQLEVDDSGVSLVLFSLADGRRTQSLEQHVIESIANQEVLSTVEVNRALDAAHSSTASSSYHSSEGTTGGVGGGAVPRQIPANNLQRGVVGYQPQIELIREGASMQATATTSDRLFVLIGAAPNINQIIRVDTFNILGNAEDAFGGGAGGGGGGIGGGQGGGGGGGGLF